MSGAFSETEFTAPLSFKTNLLAVVLLPWIAILPLIVVGPAVIVPTVLILEAPTITDEPVIVPFVRIGLLIVLLVSVSTVSRPTRVSLVCGNVKVPRLTIVLITGSVSVLLVSVSTVSRATRVSLAFGKINVPSFEIVLITGCVSVLLVNVSVAVWVTTIPELGKVAVELMPVPPSDLGRIPVTADGCDKLTAPNDGTPPPAGTVKLWYSVPGAVENRLPSALPTTMPFGLNADAPVPPRVTPSTPELIAEAGSAGRSFKLNVAPAVTRPLASTATLK